MRARAAAAMGGLSVAQVLLLARVCLGAAAENRVVTLVTANFSQHIQDHQATLVEFFAPWCGHCKKLEPEFAAAARTLAASGVPLATVDATQEKELAAKYNVKGYPTLVWFDRKESKERVYDGQRTSDSIVEWVLSMTGPPVTETADPGSVAGLKPHVVLHAGSLLPGFEDAAREHRRKAMWYFVKTNAWTPKVLLIHKDEEALELTGASAGNKDSVSTFLLENLLPQFGPLDGDTFDSYMESGKGIVWSLFPAEADGEPGAVEAKWRPIMQAVARSFKGKYHVTFTDTAKSKDAIENMLAVDKYPSIAVQKMAGDKKKYIWDGEMSTSAITRFIQDVDAGRVGPKLKSEPEPKENDEFVRHVVGSTLQREVFLPDKDVVLFIHAPWCGHCKKMEPEYQKLARKVKKDELDDLLVFTKLDGTLNDSPVEGLDWRSFPTLYFFKAGTREPILYSGERTAKGLWRYVKKHATKAQEIKERLEKKKGGTKRSEEL